MAHSSTGKSPMSFWLLHSRTPSILFPFGASGCIPIPATKVKPELAPRARPARYLYPTDHAYVTVLLTDTTTRERVCAYDFHPIHPSLDQTTMLHRAFKVSYQQPTPTQIAHDTPPPAHPHQARRYPDATYWAMAHDAELEELEVQQAIMWLTPEQTPPDCRSISLTMTYRYSRNADGSIVQSAGRR